VLRKTRKEQEWSVHFAPWFRRHLATLSAAGLKDRLMALRGDERLSSFVSFRKNQILKIVLAACSFDVDSAERPVQKSPVNRTEMITKEAERVNLAISAMKTLSEVLYLMWRVEDDGSLSQICIEVSYDGTNNQSPILPFHSGFHDRRLFMCLRDAFDGSRRREALCSRTISSTQCWTTLGRFFPFCRDTVEYPTTKTQLL
jgi:hypothetical protein